jgi:hypothetical protein
MTRREAEQIIRASPLRERLEELIAGLQPSIRIRAEKCTLDELPLGASRLGGCPDLPPGVGWPYWVGSPWVKGPDGLFVRGAPREKPLHFLAQICLDELPGGEPRRLLPQREVLYFFYDCECSPWGFDPRDRGAWRVWFVDAPARDLRRTPFPGGGPVLQPAPCRVTYSVDWTLPEDFQWPGPDVPPDDWWDVLSELTDQLTGGRGGPVHRLLGHPQLVQGEMRRECQLAANGVYCGTPEDYKSPRARELLAEPSDWRLLLQLDTDEEGPGWMWGDCGRIYFWIRDRDLSRRQFEATWLVLQCY